MNAMQYSTVIFSFFSSSSSSVCQNKQTNKLKCNKFNSTDDDDDDDDDNNSCFIIIITVAQCKTKWVMMHTF